MKVPRHIHLSIEHQPHAVNYQTVEEWLHDNEECGIEDSDRAAMLATGEVWCIRWYPRTPVGFEFVCASTLERAMELAEAIDVAAEIAARPDNEEERARQAYIRDLAGRVNLTSIWADRLIAAGTTERDIVMAAWSAGRGVAASEPRVVSVALRMPMVTCTGSELDDAKLAWSEVAARMRGALKTDSGI